MAGGHGPPDLSIVIVSWRVWPHLRRCLLALPAAAADIEYEVIVVDNASSDGTVAKLRAEFPWVEVLANRENVLYTAAANQGLAQARGRMQMLLNPDVIPHPGSITRLVRYAEAHPEAGLLGPRILDPAGRDDWRTGRAFPTPWSEFVDWSGIGRWLPLPCLLKNRRPGYDRSQTSAVPLLSGACLLFSPYLPDALRQLSAAYPMYGEDIDLCRRVWHAGLPCVLVAEARMTHVGGASSAQRPGLSAWMAVSAMNRYFSMWEGKGAARWHRWLIGWIALFKTLVFCPLRAWHPRARRGCRVYRALLAWALFGREAPEPLR